MGLSIGQFVTTCHVPLRHRNEAELVDRIARGRLAADLAGRLGPSLSRQHAIVRIRLLPIRVIIPGPELNEESVSQAWTAAFTKALFTALSYPPGTGPFEVFQAESLSAFIASAIRDLLDEAALSKWQYAEFEAMLRMGSAAGALALLCEWPEQTRAILLDLAASGTLDRMLARFDELAFERLFTLLAGSADSEPPPLAIPNLIAAARLALAYPPEKVPALRSRRYTLRLFVNGMRTSQPVRSPRGLFHSLLAVASLVDDGILPSSNAADAAGSRRLSLAAAEVLEKVRHAAAANPADRAILELQRLRNDLHVAIKGPLPVGQPAESRWISSDWCGLFLLAGPLERLGWIRAWEKLSAFRTGGVSSLIAGLSLAIAGEFDPAAPRPLDAGMALFAGFVAEPDLGHLRRVFQDSSQEIRNDVLQAAGASDPGAETWADVFGLLAERLLLDFRSRVAGFRDAKLPTLVRTFLRRSGRIRVEPERVVVVPEPSPFHVALDISGMLAPVEAVSWLGGRRLEFEVGDL